MLSVLHFSSCALMGCTGKKQDMKTRIVLCSQANLKIFVAYKLDTRKLVIYISSK